MADQFDPEHDKALKAVGEILRTLKALQVVPWPLMWAAAAIVATLYYALSRIDVLDLLRRWNAAATPLPPPSAPPVDVPADGISLPGDPRTGEQA